MELDWQQKFYEIKERGFHLLQTKNWTDCRFLVGSTPCNQEIIAGHKLILAMASPVFERMFYGQLAENDDPIVIPDVQPDIFKSMLKYIYSDRINISSIDKACKLYYVAKKYMLPHVVKQCTTFLLSNISPQNACQVYEFAKLFDDPRLMESSMKLIVLRTKEVLADPGFTDIEISTLMAILDQDKLNIVSELDLFRALLRFTDKTMFINESLVDSEQNKCQSSESDSDDENSAPSSYVSVLFSDTSVADASANKVAFPVSYNQPPTSAALVAENAQNLKNYLDEDMLKKAIKKIRFLTMTPLEFAEGPARSKLLQQHDALAILINILSPSIKDCPMPEGFCSSRLSRNYYEGQRNKFGKSRLRQHSNLIITPIPNYYSH